MVSMTTLLEHGIGTFSWTPSEIIEMERNLPSHPRQTFGVEIKFRYKQNICCRGMVVEQEMSFFFN